MGSSLGREQNRTPQQTYHKCRRSDSMILALAALLLHIPAIPQNSNSRISRVLAEASLAAVAPTNRAPTTNATAVSSDAPDNEVPSFAPESGGSEKLSEVSNVLIEEVTGPVSLAKPPFFYEP